MVWCGAGVPQNNISSIDMKRQKCCAKHINIISQYLHVISSFFFTPPPPPFSDSIAVDAAAVDVDDLPRMEASPQS